ncbi:Neutral/alkaline non-lysosomal ceramidase, N-terminal [Prosthecobacter debontii]|uniref:Neutral/alkaline non-lysosomal ceramidase, N-terminal n=1 Tax=Prosthecobacter debontii TaxID=48467 RepID=A0A1T4Y844_9BACT|nr:neutral/alkaline non-lysosomal ceramidase N-terminal domain-containing protein [Prosthecobacter debontii]SKA98002.1 Neutral/alkaline non-lysosomal ceramidase, N-terminal [Prosthecobacter debontii]
MSHTRLVVSVISLLLAGFSSARAEFRAGAFAQDISPSEFPTPVNGSMKGGYAKGISDPMHARCLAMNDGHRSLIYVVVDACMIPRQICEDAKRIASQETGVPSAHILISATHTHSAATLAGVFQSDPDPLYVKTVAPRIAQGIIQAFKNMEPAEFGWAFGSDPTHVFNRRWHMKEGQFYENPFGITTDRARMNPGNVSPSVSIPTAPVDQDVAVMAVRAKADQRPIGLLANYSLHYVGGNPAISADYYGAFAREIGTRLHADDSRYSQKPAFVGIMSNGTSGNINNINFGSSIRFKRNPGEQISIVARSVADAALAAYESIQWQKAPVIDSEETDLQLGVRKGTREEMTQAKEWMSTIPKDADGQWSDKKAIYARETMLLSEYPDTVPVKLQAQRIGNLSIAAIPCEVFVQIGLQLKRDTPFVRHFTISLANGYNGYLPTEEDHAMGGYETWRARSSYLEVPAATKITNQLETMLKALKSRANDL